VAERNHALYASHSHRELYDQLMAGKPDQIDGHAAALRSLHETVTHLSATLAGDLQELGRSWQSSSGQEYARRIGAVVTYSGQIAADLSQLQIALTSMAADLRTAQKHAESPDQVDTSNTLKDAAIGGLVFGAPGAVIGGFLGHNKDEEAKQQAHDQMVNLVANLAGQYQMRDGTWPTPPYDPSGLPGSGTGGHADPAGGPGGAGYGGAPSVRGMQGSHTGQPVPTGAQTVPPVGQVHPGDSGTSLLGAGGALIGSAALSATALDALRGGAFTPGTTANDTAGGRATNGVIGADDEDVARRSGTSAAGARGGRPAPGTPDEPEAARANRAAMGSATGNRAALAGRGERAEDEPPEHLTWLVEDEMVWGGEDGSGPAVLGVETATDGEG
jgi:uncharacterized protein YukE